MSTQTAPRPVAREYLEALLIAVIFATFARTFVFQAFKIPSGSMEENLLIGDHILVNKFIFGPAGSRLEQAMLPSRAVRRGDIVVFRWPVDPSRDFIKRAIGLPGDVVKLVDKRLYVNGQRVADESYTLHDRSSSLSRDNFGPVRVPAGNYFCLGDNRDNSADSRFWGMVPANHLKGRALLVYWSFSEAAGTPEEPVGLAARLARIAHVAAGFVSHTRWGRTLRIVR